MKNKRQGQKMTIEVGSRKLSIYERTSEYVINAFENANDYDSRKQEHKKCSKIKVIDGHEYIKRYGQLIRIDEIPYTENPTGNIRNYASVYVLQSNGEIVGTFSSAIGCIRYLNNLYPGKDIITMESASDGYRTTTTDEFRSSMFKTRESRGLKFPRWTLVIHNPRRRKKIEPSVKLLNVSDKKKHVAYIGDEPIYYIDQVPFL